MIELETIFENAKHYRKTRFDKAAPQMNVNPGDLVTVTNETRNKLNSWYFAWYHAK